MYAGTAGDRLIDWTGNHNTYYVPFSPFGMPTVSRTLQPALMQYLYALSESDGSDPILGLRYGGAATRNGEPFGELGLVLQHDAAWHTTHGPPFDKIPENLGGVAVDVKKTANVRPIESPGMDPPASGGIVPAPAPPALGSTAATTPPAAPTVSAPAYVNDTDDTAFCVTVTGQPGSVVTVIATDSATDQVTGSAIVGPGGTVSVALDVSGLATGTLTIAVGLSDSAGSSPTAVVADTKEAVVPPLTVAAPSSVSLSNVTAFGVSGTGGKHDALTITATDATTTVTVTARAIGNGSWLASLDLSSLRDGPITITVTETDGYGNQAVVTLSLAKATAPPPATPPAPTPSSGTQGGSSGGTGGFNAGQAIASLSTAVTVGMANGSIAKSKVASALQSDLQAAASAVSSGSATAAVAALRAFQSDVAANGKWITASEAAALASQATGIITRL